MTEFMENSAFSPPSPAHDHLGKDLPQVRIGTGDRWIKFAYSEKDILRARCLVNSVSIVVVAASPHVGNLVQSAKLLGVAKTNHASGDQSMLTVNKRYD